MTSAAIIQEKGEKSKPVSREVARQVMKRLTSYTYEADQGTGGRRDYIEQDDGYYVRTTTPGAYREWRAKQNQNLMELNKGNPARDIRVLMDNLTMSEIMTACKGLPGQESLDWYNLDHKPRIFQRLMEMVPEVVVDKSSLTKFIREGVR